MSINVSELTKENPQGSITERPRRGKKKTNILRQSQEYRNTESKLQHNENADNMPAKSSNKVITEPITKVITKGQQTDNKVVTRTGNKNSDSSKSSNKVITEPITKVITKGQQTDNKLITNPSYRQFSGLQKRILDLIYKSCRERGAQETHPISINFLSELLNSTSGSVKMSINRLLKKGAFSRSYFKNGRGGWTQYLLNKVIYNEMLQNESSNKLITNWQQTGNKVDTELVTKLITSPSSSNSSINNTITTKKDENWLQEIQTPENLKFLGLGVNHIRQLKDKFSLSTEEIQQGLEAFAYDLANGELERLKKRGIQNIIGYFFGAMKGGGYNSVKKDYISAEDLAEKEMIERLEKKKEERLERKKKLEELLFNEWLETKSKNDILRLEPPLVDYMDSFHKTALMEYFLSHEAGEFQKGFKYAKKN